MANRTAEHQLVIRVTLDMYAEVKAAAAAADITISQIVRKALRDFVAEQKAKVANDSR